MGTLGSTPRAEEFWDMGLWVSISPSAWCISSSSMPALWMEGSGVHFLKRFSSRAPLLSHLHPGDVSSLPAPPSRCPSWPGSPGPEGLPSVHSALTKLPRDRTVPAVQRKRVGRGLSWRPPGWGSGAAGSKPRYQISPVWSCRGTATPQVTALHSAACGRAQAHPPCPLPHPGVPFPLGSEPSPQATAPSSDPGPPNLSPQGSLTPWVADVFPSSQSTVSRGPGAPPFVFGLQPPWETPESPGLDTHLSKALQGPARTSHTPALPSAEQGDFEWRGSGDVFLPGWASGPLRR